MNSNWVSEQSIQNCITFKVFLLIPERFQKNVCSRVLFSESYWLMANNCTQNAFYFWHWFSFSKKATSCWPKYNKSKFITEILSEFPSKNTFQHSLLRFTWKNHSIAFHLNIETNSYSRTFPLPCLSLVIDFNISFQKPLNH